MSSTRAYNSHPPMGRDREQDPPGTWDAHRVVAGLYGACLTLLALSLLGVVTPIIGGIAALTMLLLWAQFD